MTTPTDAACALGIAPATLSALRDESLPPAETQRLRAHIPTCAACQARIAAFNRVGLALRRQRDLEPGAGVWATLQPQVLRKGRFTMPTTRRNFIGGTIAALSVIILVALFAQVLRHHGAVTIPGTAGPTATTSASFTPHPKPSPPPTSTPVSLNGLPIIPASVAVASFSLGDFQVGGITPDGQRLLGYRLSSDGKNYDVGWLDVTTHAFTAFDESPVNGTYKGNTPPTCCITDGRYYVGGNGIIEGASGTAPFYYDSQTDKLHLVTAPSLTFFPYGIHNGVVYARKSMSADTSLFAVDLATGTETVIPGTSTAFNFYSFSWPYLLYTDSNQVYHVHDIQNNTDATQSQLGNASTTFGGVLNGDTLFTLLGNSSNNGTSGLLESPHVMMPTNTPSPLTSVPGEGDIAAANDRLVALSIVDFSCPTAGSGNPCHYRKPVKPLCLEAMRMKGQAKALARG
jgi:hypothetical protein